MKLNYKFTAIGCLFLSITFSCGESFLNKRPYGALSESILYTKSGVDGLLIGAYSLLDGGGARGGDFWSWWEYLIAPDDALSLIHISEPTRRTPISYAVF